MVNQGWRRVIRRRLWRRGVLSGRRLRSARARHEGENKPKPCREQQSEAAAHYKLQGRDRRRTFARNSTHSATPARRFCAEPRAFRSITTQLLLHGVYSPRTLASIVARRQAERGFGEQ